LAPRRTPAASPSRCRRTTRLAMVRRATRRLAAWLPQPGAWRGRCRPSARLRMLACGWGGGVGAAHTLWRRRPGPPGGGARLLPTGGAPLPRRRCRRAAGRPGQEVHPGL
jgi:hypothetical protein